jgi:RHS repeat-associated protein
MQLSLTTSNSFAMRNTRILLLVLLLPLTALAQPNYDGSTPSGLSRGTPAGSYALTGFDNVNLFNGHMNFHLPLVSVGGRKAAGYTIMLPIEQVWTAQVLDPINYFYNPNYNWWDGIKPGYSAGVLQARHQSEGCEDGLIVSFPAGITRLTFTLPDGTEHELIDQLFGGQQTQSMCNMYEYNPQNGVSRGTTWVTRDGTAATFISDQAIRDVLVETSGPWVTYPSGYLKLANGTTYRIVSGRVQWLRDQNGNRTTFENDTAGRPTVITDSINRRVTIEYLVQDAQYGLCDRISFKGSGGATRVLRVLYKELDDALDAGQTAKTYGGANGLFPELSGSSTTIHNPQITSGVVLPDGRSYQFLYNSYGELTRVTLPTGGVFTYLWGAGLASGPPSGAASPTIYRRVLEKRTFSDNGSTLAGLTTFGRYDNVSGPEGSVAVQQRSIDGNATVISQSKHYFHSGPLANLHLSGMFLPDLIDGREKKTERLNQAGTTVLQRTTMTWVYGGSLAGTSINPQVTETVQTIEPAAANLVSKQTFTYDTYNNRTNSYEYGFGSGSSGPLVRRTNVEYLTTNPVNGLNYATNLDIHLRILPKHQQIFEGAVLRAKISYEYDKYTTDSNHAGLVDRSSISGLDVSFTPSYVTRGNATAATRSLVNTSGDETGSISTYAQFDIAGNVVKSIDALGYASLFDFADRFGSPDGNAQANSGATELGSQVSYGFVTKTTNALSHITYSQFDYYTGRPVDTEDANGIINSLYYNDALERLTQMKRAVGISGTSQISFSYDDPNRIVTTTGDLNTLGDNVLTSKAVYDPLGRLMETRQYEGGTNYTVTQTQYDALGRAFKASNPFRPWQSQTAVWTTQAFDDLGRIITVTAPDNAVVSTVYSGNSVKVTDPAGKARKTVTDALGRVIEVYEDPNGLNYLTTYTYDVLDNLVKITQGSQQRFFMYDSVKRLIRARNTEHATLSGLNLSDPITGNSSWSVGYQYDANNNLTQKTDPRGVTSTYVYDALNRTTTVDHSDTGSVNPDVKRFYDGATNGKGRFWYHYTGGDLSIGSNVEHTIIDSYDAPGRPTVQRQLFKLNGTWSGAYQTSRAYNLAGAITSLVYPSGHSVTYNYDTVGRLADKDASNLAFTGNLGDGVLRTYSSGNTYSQWGRLTMERFGTQTPLYHKLQYNIRGQLWDVRVATGSDVNGSWNRGALQMFYESTYTHGASGPDNNGNVVKTNHYVPLDDSSSTWAIHDQLYSYDSLNRLASVAEYFISSTQALTQQSMQSYTYDRWGNRTINPSSWGTGINTKQFTVDTATNRLGVPGGQPGTMTYDSAGNLTTDTYTGSGNRTYDAENRMLTAVDFTAQTSRYTYDADGKRTRRQVGGGQEVWQIYGFDGELLAEYAATSPASTPTREYGYRNGELLVTTTEGSGTKSLSLNGTSNYAQVPSSSSLNISGSITLEAWVKRNASSNYQDIINRESWGQSGTGGGYELSVTNIGKARLDLYQTPTTYTTVVGSTTLTTDVWHHIAGVFDGSQMRIYVDGVLDGSVSSSSAPASGTSNVRLGRNSGSGTYFFNGLIDEVRISNTALYTANFTPQMSLSATGSTKGLWKFDGQNLNDASGNGNTGNLISGSYSNDIPVGNAYYSGSFNGTNAYAEVPSSSSLNISGSLTLEAWVKINAIGNYQDIINRESWGQSGTGGGYELSVTNIGKARLDLYQTPTTYTTLVGTTTLSTGVWHHIAATFDGSGMRIYVNGTLDASNSNTSAPASGTSNVRLGRNSGSGTYFFNGLIDEVRISNAAIYTSNFTPQQHLTATGNTKGLWKFDSQSPNDSSTNGNNATFQGGTTYSDDVPGGGGGGGVSTGVSTQIQWLVSDHLGTPRIVVDLTGSRVNVKRHDYLPFGEELHAGSGGRTTALGYSTGDGIRQQFTSKERDVETGLDYFLARYYSPVQGRFSSPDEFNGGPVEIFAQTASANPTFYADLSNPQTLNKYQYCLNNPLRYTDPYGHQQKDSWYDRLMTFLGLLWKSAGNGSSGMNYEEAERTKDGGNGPFDMKAHDLASKSWMQFGTGLEALAEIEMTLFDPFGAVGAANDVMNGDYVNLGVGMVFRAGGPVLGKFFGVAAKELLSGKLLLGGTKGTREIAAAFQKTGSTLVANIVDIRNPTQKGLSGLTRELYKNIMELAKQTGATEITVNAIAVTNDKLRAKLIADGWKPVRIKIEGWGWGEGFTKTFPVKK